MFLGVHFSWVKFCVYICIYIYITISQIDAAPNTKGMVGWKSTKLLHRSEGRG